MPSGRLTIFTQELADDICKQLSEGKSLRSICKDEAYPTEACVRQWASEDRSGFYSQYTRARDIGLDSVADEVMEIADGGSEDVQRDRLRFDSRRWYLSKLAPKRYGDKVTNEHTGPEGGPIQVTRIELVAASGVSE